ncbi:response regulator [Colwellia sp. MB02u-9]|uniref:response regulator n=1 Tax=Colwellia sp. MB02u-9 TaxID=2759823 RepID=UPI0015F6C651|nr:response regulator [Colwellia sp. MB02u-9]MBA6297283.1 response regulator [Colwellia sp. MB02u-9]
MRITIRFKLLVSFVLFSMLLVFSAYYGVNSLHEVNNGFNAQKIKLAARINQGVIAVSRAEKNIILSIDTDEIDEYIDFIRFTTEDMEQRRQLLRSLVDDESNVLLDKFSKTWGGYLRISNKINNLGRVNANTHARELSQGEAREAFDRAALAAQKIADSNELEAVAAKEIEILRKVAVKIKLGTQLALALTEMQRAEKNFILAKTQKEMQEYIATGKLRKEEVSNLFEVLKPLLTEEGRLLGNRFIQSYNDYELLYNKVQELTLLNTNAKAYNLSTGKGRQLNDLAQKQMAAIVEKAESDLDVDKAANDQRIEDARNFLITLTLISLIIIVFIALFLTNTINSSLSDAIIYLKSIAKGDLTSSLEKKRDDEIGELIDNINAINVSLQEVNETTNNIANGNYDQKIVERSTHDVLSQSLNVMSKRLASITLKNSDNEWLAQGQIEINKVIRDVKNAKELAEAIISHTTQYINGQVGTFYELADDTENEQDEFFLTASYAFTHRKGDNNRITMGEGLLGQAAFEKKILSITHLPEHYTRINSSLGDTLPSNALLIPLLIANKVVGVIEIAAVTEFTSSHLKYCEVIAQAIAAGLQARKGKDRIDNLLADAQSQTEELASQSEELRATNEQLEEKNSALDQQKKDLQKQAEDIAEKAAAIEVSSKYKSEFLANMSHELRTPLNSFLLLSKALSDNPKGNLDEEQLEDIKIIYEGGTDLLHLINDIMDLSKVEAGKLTLQNEEVTLDHICKNLQNLFSPSAKDKALAFTVTRDDDAPATIISDQQRLEQILKNFLSNAFKFTPSGTIEFTIKNVPNNVRFLHANLQPTSAVALSVTDTGIGIAANKQREIFEAFQQADGSTSRKYGGTGLGLTISKELAHLLGGEIQLSSIPGQGSTFTLYLPIANAALSNTTEHTINNYTTPSLVNEPIIEIQQSLIETTPINNVESLMGDDSHNISEGDNVILIIEDDEAFAKTLLKMVRGYGYKGLVATDGRNGLYKAFEYKPKGIFLDLGLPDLSGKEVLEQLKFHLSTKHTPVHIITGTEEDTELLKMGARSFAQKPVDADDIEKLLQDIEYINSGEIRKILIIEDDENSRHAISQLIENKGIKTSSINSGNGALTYLHDNEVDCIILDLGLPDISGFDFLDILADNLSIKKTPVIVFTGAELDDEQRSQLNKHSVSLILKDAASPDKLLDEALMFMHSMSKDLSSTQKKSIYNIHDESKLLTGRKVLLVDDDIRNTFALSKNLQRLGLTIYEADNGQTALNKLVQHNDIELILMDIMMPVMDGYEAMKKIRQDPLYKDVPIIALTAKAMPQDRAKCIQAGATDYLTKPIDFDKLCSMLKVWLFKK